MARVAVHGAAMVLLAALALAAAQYPFRSYPPTPYYAETPKVHLAATPITDPAIMDAADKCFPKQECDVTARYRTLDGSCNNLNFSMWGQANTALSRLVAAFYQDGVHSVRKSRLGRALPSARLLVTQLTAPIEVPDNVNTLLLMSIAQLISHDASFIKAASNPSSACCSEEGPGCLNIDVPFDDRWYTQWNISCLPFERAATTASIGCPLRPEYTLASVSHFLDASFLYGTSVDRLAQLREGMGGRLRGQPIRGHTYPLSVPKPTKVCAVGDDDALCIDSGDFRTNQNPPLAALHILFFREHNRVAEQLALLNPHWDDERIFQESRRVIIAEWQIIVYRDWLPWMIGHANALAEGLVPVPTGMSTDYDETLNPSTTNDFSSAAYRAFHSIIPPTYCRVGGQEKTSGCPIGAQSFSNSFGNPTVLGTDGGLDSVLEGCTTQPMGRMDRLYSMQISGQMFRGGKPWGWDLISMDIQRGRDVGLPGYNTYRTLCGMKAAHRWEHLLDSFEGKIIRKLTDLYDHPDDIDLYVGGMLEKRVPGSLVGPTFQCILVDQFKRWKRGDRFFYDLDGYASSFRPDQVQALRATSMARLLCDNGDKISTVSKDPFVQGYEKVHCTQIPSINLMHWREQL